VIRPPSRNRLQAGQSLDRGAAPHALVTAKSPTGTISGLKRPSSIAAAARRFDSAAKTSISWRLMSQVRAILLGRVDLVHFLVAIAPRPARRAGEGRLEPVGLGRPYIAAEDRMAFIFCTPPAITRSCVPLITPCAAKWIACCELPHCRSMVTPGTASG